MDVAELHYRLVVAGLPKKHRPLGWESVGSSDTEEASP